MNTSQQSQEFWEGNIQKQLWHLRYDDPTQYNALVKMHLSFTTDIPVDECDGRTSKQSSSRKWQLTPLIRLLGRSAASGKGVMEGAPLTQEGVCQAFQLIHFLNKDYNISQEGLFRKTGSLSRQQELKNLLNSGGDLNLDSGSHSAHDCASVLKSFLADLPEPLLTEGHYSIHCKITEMVHSDSCEEQKEMVHTRQIKSLRLLFLLLPPENYQLLQDLLILLNRVAANQKQNLMSATNLGTMFAPHILCPRKMTANDLQFLSGVHSIAVAFMIENAPELFQIPIELEYDIRHYWNNKKKLKHQLSKRSMMDAPTSTIFTFTDRELTAQANDKDVTEVALAELYAYVQSLPDSAKKRRLIKKFNHASGFGTPQLHNSIYKKQEVQGKKLGDSIKKHLFHKTVKVSKIKSQPTVSSAIPLGVKRTNSEDLLRSPSSRSPELRRFHHSTDETDSHHSRAKSLDDLSSFTSELTSPVTVSMNKLSCTSIIHPAFNPQSNYRCRLKIPSPIAIPRRHYSGCNSVSDSESTCSLASPLPLTPLPVNTSYDSQDDTGSSGSGEFDYPPFSSTTKGSELTTFNLPQIVVEDFKENANPMESLLHSTSEGAVIDVHSPISEAMLRSSIPQKVIMTPRSRCPIIVNSATNLANTAIPEERDSFNSSVLEVKSNQDADSQNQHHTTIIGNPTAKLFLSPNEIRDPVLDVSEVSKTILDPTDDRKDNESETGDSVDDDKGGKLRRWKSSSLRRTLSSASSTGSLFGSFFHHLSASSLGQLATRLTSSSSVARNLQQDEEEKIDHEMSICKEDGAMNESLSSVFRDYLLSRSILTDNPVDLSVQCSDTGGIVDPVSGETNDALDNRSETSDQTCSSISDRNEHLPRLSQQCSTPSLASTDSAVGLSPNVSLSESLLFCLDGNNPLSTSCIENVKSTKGDDEKSGRTEELHSCTPESRLNSILQTKQGTPIPLRERESTNSLSSTKGVLFETSF